MTINREVFAKDPMSTTLPNQGVAEVVEPTSQQQWDVLRWELASFVCDGEYYRGLDRILSSFLGNLDKPVQPAVWVSGFYGSGKSHLVRVLEFLWRDVRFPDGARASGVADLPAEIRAHLKELETRGRQNGGLWAAAAKLSSSAGGWVRPAIAAAVSRSAGLPERVHQARFVLWLQQNGFYRDLFSMVEQEGKSFQRELANLYVSPVLARALLKVCPNLAANETAVHTLLQGQYPEQEDISTDEMVDLIEQVLELQSTRPGSLPCTLLVLDELQQYIGDNSERTLQVQEAVEACSKRFGSQLLVVATGQSALQATPQLQKLQDRFTVRVELSDTDVERVVRQVVLLKAPGKKDVLQQVIEGCRGEIDQHLPGTKIGPVGTDAAALVPDYPVLPTRHRFWERVLRSVDRAGASGQLRTQLRIIFEAARAVADKPLGTVVAADLLFDQQAPSMLATGVLLHDVNDIIMRERDAQPDGPLRSRLCATIFLVSQLPQQLGVRATADTLADLLVEDLTTGSANLRQRIPGLLEVMVQRGSLQPVEDEYRLQTREGAEWMQDYQGRYAAIVNDEGRLATDLAAALKEECSRVLGKISILQGQSKTPRKMELVFSAEEPYLAGGAVPVWIRDEWSVPEKTVREDAAAGGTDSPVVYVFLPRRGADALKSNLAGYAAATATLTRPEPNTPEGHEARQGMVTRQAAHKREIDALLGAVLKDALVFQGGGSEVHPSVPSTNGNVLRDAVRAAADASLVRLFPQFALADSPQWGKVVTRVRQGSGDALSVLGYQGNANEHPVCQEVLKFLAAGQKGSEARRWFAGRPYGWTQDAIDGALLALVAGDFARASLQGQVLRAPALDQQKIAQAIFAVESVNLTAAQKIAIRGLLQAAGIPVKANEEANAMPAYLRALLDLAAAAGGDAPLPATPDTTALAGLQAKSGNALLLAVWEMRDELEGDRKRWAKARDLAQQRLPRWHTARRLLQHAQSLPIAGETGEQIEAVRTGRSLLDDPDPVPSLASRLADALREALTVARGKYTAAFTTKMQELQESADWKALASADQARILRECELREPPAQKMGSESEVAAALDAISLQAWANLLAALPERVARALLAAAQALQPKAVRVDLPHRTLQTEEDLDAYVEQVRALIRPHLQEKRPVVL